MSTDTNIDHEKVMALFGNVFNDVAGSIAIMMSYIGDQTGVYKAMDKLGSASVAAIAKEADVDERYLKEWLASNAGRGYVNFNPDSEEFSLSPEQAAVFAREGEPTCIQGLVQGVVGQFVKEDVAIDVFKTGRGRPWGEHHECCFCGTERFFRPAYAGHLLEEWIPAMDGVQEKLKKGAKVADIGCGLGTSSMLMAEEFPNSTIHAYDFHGPSIEEAKKRAADKGLTNLEFFVSDASNIPNNGYDLACIFDAWHDMGDPVGIAEGIKDILTEDGTFMVVEPMALDGLANNIANNPSSSMFYGFGTLICVPASKAQPVGLGLGPQAGPKKLMELLSSAGFDKVNLAAKTTSNLVLQATN
ncbi:MAG: class I SAM-dependent methyltransferase [Gammaproteobacteria bacterium]|tara:strand:+ start:1644 stop:2717 length:1074 start_codon:yes stop_codon:yes gene_type:complete